MFYSFFFMFSLPFFSFYPHYLPQLENITSAEGFPGGGIDTSSTEAERRKERVSVGVKTYRSVHISADCRGPAPGSVR